MVAKSVRITLAPWETIVAWYLQISAGEWSFQGFFCAGFRPQDFPPHKSAPPTCTRRGHGAPGAAGGLSKVAGARRRFSQSPEQKSLTKIALCKGHMAKASVNKIGPTRVCVCLCLCLCLRVCACASVSPCVCVYVLCDALVLGRFLDAMLASTCDHRPIWPRWHTRCASKHRIEGDFRFDVP